MSTPIILDCDPGHDDAIALLLALASPEVELLCVTTVHGNQTLAKTTENALRVLDLAGAPTSPSPPEPSGRSCASSPSPLTCTARAASTGRRCDLRAARHGRGRGRVDARTIAASAAPVTLVPTGPLTNIARLLLRTGGANIGRIVLMGGAIAEGNMTPAAEFNIWADPEAAQAVFHSGLDVCMIGLDVTHRAVTTPALQEHLRRSGRTGTFVAELVDFFAVYHRETYGWDGAPIHDAVAVAHVLRPGIVTTLRATSRSSASRSCAGDARSSTAGGAPSGSRMPTSASTSTPMRSSISCVSGSRGSVNCASPPRGKRLPNGQCALG